MELVDAEVGGGFSVDRPGLADDAAAARMRRLDDGAGELFRDPLRDDQSVDAGHVEQLARNPGRVRRRVDGDAPFRIGGRRRVDHRPAAQDAGAGNVAGVDPPAQRADRVEIQSREAHGRHAVLDVGEHVGVGMGVRVRLDVSRNDRPPAELPARRGSPVEATGVAAGMHDAPSVDGDERILDGGRAAAVDQLDTLDEDGHVGSFWVLGPR